MTQEPIESLAQQAESLPREPGVYLFKDALGRVLYVGKARDLRARVRQYLGGHDERFMVRFLLQSAVRIDTTLVRSEKEALILENTLIKRHRPRYNAKLVDDSSFLHLRIDLEEEWPRFSLVREVAPDGSRIFGPYHSASQARATLAFLERRFPLRTCSDSELKSRDRPCLLHQMGRCLAPCVDLCTKEEYAAEVEQSMLFLSGRGRELLNRLQARMMEHAAAERFEQAARDRDLMKAVQASIERQGVADARQADRDVWGIHGEGEQGVVVLLPVRKGMVQEAIPMPFEDLETDQGVLLASLLNRWYQPGQTIPPELLLSTAPADVTVLAELLGERRGSAVRIQMPVQGEKRRLVELALRNARLAATREGKLSRGIRSLEDLQRVCQLDRLPRRIECFDNSNIEGQDAVAAMVVFIDGRPEPGEYRRYRVKTVEGADDYATMREILRRRFTRALETERSEDPRGWAEPGVDRKGWARPDLLVVDGGKGQVAAAKAVLADLGLHDQPLIGLSKPRTEHARGDREATDKIVLPGAKDPIRLDAHRPALTLLQAIRDESHKTAIGYHRETRRRRQLGSSLDDLPGVGATRRKALLTHFESIAAIKAASVEELAAVPGLGKKTAAAVYAALRGE